MSHNRFVAACLLGAASLLAPMALSQAPALPTDTQPAGATASPETVPASSQPAPPPTSQPASAEPGRYFRFRELTLNFGLEGRFDQRRVSSETHQWFPRHYGQTNRDQHFEETIGGQTDFWLFDERVMQFNLAGLWGLTQERFSEVGTPPDRTESSHGDILQYDLTWTLFPRGKVSATAYASQVESRVPRTFLPSLNRTLEKYGVDVYYNDRTLPMRFSFEHVWDELTSRTRNLSDDELRNHDRFRYEGTWQISENQALRMEYEHEQRSEQYSGSNTEFDTTRDFALLNHMLRFGPDGRSSWETTARFQNERGELGRDDAEISTRLRLQHTDSLSSNYAAQFLQQEFQELSTTTWRAEAGVTHQLGETLTTSLQMYGLKQQADQYADLGEWGGLLSSAFSKENALGRLSANVSYNHTDTDTDNGTRRGIVIGEAVTFRDPLSTYLLKSDVRRASIVVTDATHTRTYLRGRDYLVIGVGHYTALSRVPNGQIADRQTVLVSYTYGFAENYGIRRDRLDWRIQQEFKFGLTPYYAGSVQTEDVEAGRSLLVSGAIRGRDVNHHRVGAIFRQPRWSVSGEYEYNDDSVDPYQAVHLDGDVVIWQSARQQLDGKFTAARFWFDGQGAGTKLWFDNWDSLAAHNTTLLDLGTSYRYLIAESLEANLTGLYRYEDDSHNGVTNGIDLSAALDWKLGLFSLRFEAEYDMLDVPGSGDDSFSFWIKLRREIPVIARKDQ